MWIKKPTDFGIAYECVPDEHYLGRDERPGDDVRDHFHPEAVRRVELQGWGILTLAERDQSYPAANAAFYQ